jgi:anti-sigma B factor antagonist
MVSAFAQTRSVPSHTPVSVRVGTSSHAATVVLDGEVDLACADALRTTLAEQRAADRRYVRVDTSAVSFLDATVLEVLLEAHNEFLARRGTLVIAGVTPRIQRLLRLTGLDEVLFLADVGPSPSPSRSRRVTEHRRSRAGSRLRALRPATPTS